MSCTVSFHHDPGSSVNTTFRSGWRSKVPVNVNSHMPRRPSHGFSIMNAPNQAEPLYPEYRLVSPPPMWVLSTMLRSAHVAKNGSHAGSS